MSNKYTYELDEDFLKEFFLLGECNIEDYSKISGESFWLALKKIKTLCNFEKKDISKIDDKDGLKIYLDNGLSWILVRKSGTEPLLRIYFESYDNKKLKLYKQNIISLFNF